VRVYLIGPVCVQHGGAVVPQRAFPGPQGRVVFAMLAAEHGRPLARDRLAEELWNGEPPAGWEVAVRALVSAAVGCYQLNLPGGAWVDLDAAGAAVHRAEAALATGRLELAGSEALVASMISRRPFLAGCDGP
jgi:SARP family transcriptional regulator, regulator of embCAB operon